MDVELKTGAHIVLWAIPVVLLAISLLVIVCNWSIFISGCISRKETTSIIPFIGGICGAAGLRLLPVEAARKYAWAPLLFDYGCVPYIALILYFMLRYGKNGPPEVANEEKQKNSQR